MNKPKSIFRKIIKEIYNVFEQGFDILGQSVDWSMVNAIAVIIVTMGRVLNQWL